MKKSLENELKEGRVLEVEKDVWMIEGYLSDAFALRAPSCNIYLLRNSDDLYLLDTGFHAFYRERMLQLIDRYKKDGVKRITLLITQGHFDHAFNNDVILESGLDWRFFLPEPEVFRTSSFDGDFLDDLKHLSDYENIFSTMLPRRPPTGVVRAVNNVSPSLAWKLMEKGAAHLMGGAETLAEKAVILKEADRVSRRFGNTDLTGWEVGPFFLVHDASHTQGHVCLYDPERKLLLAGDVTIEINPAFFYSSTKRCEEAAGWFRHMAEDGFIQTAGDSHRTSTYLPRLLEKRGLDLLHRTQGQDLMRGKQECADFFGFFEDYYHRLQKEVLEAHRRCGRVTVADIVEELHASKDPAMTFKVGMRFPDFPSRLDVLVAGVLRDEGARPHREGKRIVFDPL